MTETDTQPNSEQERSRERLNRLVTTFTDELSAELSKHSDALESELELPTLDKSLYGRQTLVVVVGPHYKEDLAMLKTYIREYKPVLIGVDNGADALLDAGQKPDIIVGNLDSVGEAAVNSGAVLLAHAETPESPTGIGRVQDMDLAYTEIRNYGSNRDAGLLVADSLQAPLVVAVGIRDTLFDLLQGHNTTSSASVLTDLRLGSRVINAKGVSLLYRRQISTWQLVLLALSGLFALGVALAVTDAGQTFLGIIGAYFDGFFSWVSTLFNGAPPSQDISRTFTQHHTFGQMTGGLL